MHKLISLVYVTHLSLIQVTVLQPNDWKRIQDVLSKTNYEAQRQEAIQKEREELHNISANMVKNWGNTIEGQRLQKLKARKIKEDKEEEEKKLIDIEEAKHQAQKRKDAIERAKTLQYHKTDRVKGYHSALLLTEVLRERDAQVKMKNKQAEATKNRDDHLIELQRKQYEEGILQDQEKALKRYNARQQIRDFQQLQIKEKDEVKVEEKELDFAKGENIKEQVAMYKAAKATIEEQRREQKRSLMESHKKAMRDRQIFLEKERQKDEDENEEIRQFAIAKKKMSKMRKEKEVELFETFQEHTEKMRSKLAGEMKQKVDDEDDRLAKAVAERDDKIAKEEQDKREKEMLTRKSIHDHRMNTIKDREKKIQEDLENDYHLLKIRVESDKKSQKEEDIKQSMKRDQAKRFQNIHKDQIKEKANRKNEQANENLNFDRENARLMAEEEAQFQDYANKVLSEQKIKDPPGNHFPLIKAANEGPGGGRGPRFEGRSGYRPSYIVSDSTGVQLPNYSQDTAARSKIQGRPGQSFKRLGFNW
ncbi:coiled-coil domain-containing protein 173-like isoform X2 [Dendronephthya gigantea]|uniref:coiled-coil domain-containing protein 173-like isoform X2 n=1 Tax=Dendronephthya gigantea TaxID=151771 RepID=UPI00106C2228|nr:coiled-coil domain-containing protein 173-like isoform X2 [Dendronephthya gigantea]